MFAEDPEEMEVLASKRDGFIPCYMSISKTGWLRPRHFSGLTGETLPSLPACTHPVKLKHSPQNVLQAKKNPSVLHLVSQAGNAHTLLPRN